MLRYRDGVERNRLAGAQAKLRRARDHLDDLVRRFYEWAYEEGGLDPPVAKRYEPEHGRFVYFVTAGHRPPLELSLVAGDVVQNARAALDYLVWEMVDAAGTILTPGQASAVLFPICATRREFDQAVGRRMPGVGAGGLAVVSRYQPFRFPSEPPPPLARLQRLSNDDKHRTLRVMVTHPTRLDFDVPPFDQFPDFEVTHGERVAQELDDAPPGTDIVRLYGTPKPRITPDVKMRFGGQSVAAFEGESLDFSQSLGEIVNVASEILSEAESLV